MDETLPPEVPPAAPPANDSGLTLLIGLAVGVGYYWFASRQALGAGAEDEGDDDGEEYEEEDDVEEPQQISELSDATTDALIDRPAMLARSGKAGDCYKAVKLLPMSQALARNQSETKVFRRVLKSVSDDCQGVPDAVERAMEEIEARRDEIEEVLDVDTTEIDSDSDRNIQARRAAQASVKRGDLTRTRKKRQPRSEVIDMLDKVAHSKGSSAKGGRPRGASVRVKRKGGESYRLRQEKAPTKRGYKWRKESV